MAESGGLSGSGRIRASTKKLTDRVWEKRRICMNTDKWQNPRHYRDLVESLRVPKLMGQISKKGRIRLKTDKWENPEEYQDQVESLSVPKN